MALTKALQSIPLMDERTARRAHYFQLADVAYETEGTVQREALYVIGREGDNPEHNLFFFRKLYQPGDGVASTFDTLPLKRIREYLKMTLAKQD